MKLIADGIGVDAGMIIICDVDYFKSCPSPDLDRLYLGQVLDVPVGVYKADWAIKDTWNGPINGQDTLVVSSGQVAVIDPCYVIGQEKHDDWIKWLDDCRFFYTDDHPSMQKNEREKYGLPEGVFVLDDMGGDGCYKVELNLELVVA